MIGRLSGTVVERGGDGTCILDVSGVGYELFVPLGALGRLPAPPERTTLFVHTHVREDAFTLFGFASRADRDAFRILLGVSSIGPKLALSIMSVLDSERLAAAIASADKTVFKGIPGVGKKTVDRLLVDLADKVPALAGAKLPPGIPAAAAPPLPTGVLGTVVSALIQMGYKPPEAYRAAEQLKERADDKPVEALLREALAILA